MEVRRELKAWVVRILVGARLERALEEWLALGEGKIGVGIRFGKESERRK